MTVSGEPRIIAVRSWPSRSASCGPRSGSGYPVACRGNAHSIIISTSVAEPTSRRPKEDPGPPPMTWPGSFVFKGERRLALHRKSPTKPTKKKPAHGLLGRVAIKCGHWPNVRSWANRTCRDREKDGNDLKRIFQDDRSCPFPPSRWPKSSVPYTHGPSALPGHRWAKISISILRPSQVPRHPRFAQATIQPRRFRRNFERS